MPKLPGVNHLQAVRALEKAGFHSIRQGRKHIVMSDGTRFLTIPRKNPYSSPLKRQVTIRLDEQTIRNFKDLSEEMGIPYQTLINLYPRDCAASWKRL